MVTIDNLGVRQVLTDYIALSEGRENKVYLDTKKIETIGIGFNLTRNGARAAVTGVGADFDRIFKGLDTLTDEQIDKLFLPDVDASIAGARRVVKSFDKLNLARQIVVVDMVFNNGEAGFKAFAKTLDAIEKADFEKAADEMQKAKWFKQVGDRGPRNVLAMRTGALEARFQQKLNAIERADAKAGSKEGQKEGKEASKDSKDAKEGKERAKETKEGKDGKDGKDVDGPIAKQLESAPRGNPDLEGRLDPNVPGGPGLSSWARFSV